MRRKINSSRMNAGLFDKSFLFDVFFIVFLSVFSCSAFSMKSQDVFCNLGLDYSVTNQEDFLTTLRKNVQETLKTCPNCFGSIETRAETLGKYGLNNIKSNIIMLDPFGWMDTKGGGDWSVICYLEDAVRWGFINGRISARNPVASNFDAVKEYFLSEKSESDWCTLERLLKNSQEFLQKKRKHILEYNVYDEYDFKLMRDKVSIKNIIFRDIAESVFPDLKNNPGPFLLWYDVLLIAWIDVTSFAHIDYRRARERESLGCPVLDWRAASFSPSVEYVIPDNQRRLMGESALKKPPEKEELMETSEEVRPFISGEESATSGNDVAALPSQETGAEGKKRVTKKSRNRTPKSYGKKKPAAASCQRDNNVPVTLKALQAELAGFRDAAEKSRTGQEEFLRQITKQAKAEALLQFAKFKEELISHFSAEASKSEEKITALQQEVARLQENPGLSRKSQCLNFPLMAGSKQVRGSDGVAYIELGGLMTPTELFSKQILDETGFGHLNFVNLSPEVQAGVKRASQPVFVQTIAAPFASAGGRTLVLPSSQNVPATAGSLPVTHIQTKQAALFGALAGNSSRSRVNHCLPAKPVSLSIMPGTEK